MKKTTLHGHWMDQLLTARRALALRICQYLCTRSCVGCTEPSVDVSQNIRVFDRACPVVSLPDRNLRDDCGSCVSGCKSSPGDFSLPFSSPNDTLCPKQSEHLLTNSVTLNTHGYPACMCGTCRHSEKLGEKQAGMETCGPRSHHATPTVALL